MKKILIPIFLFLFSQMTLGELLEKKFSWKVIYQSPIEIISIDDNLIKINGNYVSFWYLQEMTGWKNNYWIRKEVYDCKNKKALGLYYYQGENSFKNVPKDIPDLTSGDYWIDLTSDRYVPTLYKKLCVKKIYF
jgi:hypothetical protein